MKIVNKNCNELLIKPKTHIEISQAIANLSLQNTQGQYEGRIQMYKIMLEKYKSVPCSNRVASYSATQEETAAIMLFNKDKEFTITE